MAKKIKLVFFDVEGTLFKKVYKDSQGNTAPSAWTLIAEHLGPEAHKEEEETKVKWTNKKYAGYVEWMDDTVRIHQKYGLKKDLFDQVVNSVDFQPGVKETFKELKKRGLKTAVICGGFKASATRAQKELKIDHAFAACEYFWDEKGKILHWNTMPCDYEGKTDFMKLIIKEHGLTPDECAFVGDGRNDVPLAKAVGLSISFNGPKELQEASTYSINQPEGKEDFREILKYI